MDARAPVDESDGATAAIAIDELSKVYHLDATRVARLRRLLRLGGHPMEVRALDRLSLSVRPGEALGVIGENGAGKSTLMKIVAGTTQPSSGQVQVNGLVASILELGAGFHPEFSGRDNAMLYGALMGIGRDEMRRRLERILEFAELGEFIVHPIKSYSTGMTMRLAFAVATHVSPAILVIDEALAVGDGYFQKKCIDRLIEVKARGTTILFCSHAMYFVTQFCDRVAWLERGRLRRLGPTQEVVDAYEASLLLREKRRLGDDDASTAPGLGSAGTVGAKVGRIAALRLLDESGREVSDGLKPGQPFTVEVQVESARPEEPYHVGVAIDTVDGRCVLGLSTSWDGEPPLSGRSSYRMRLEIPGVPMAHGTFHVSAFLLDDTGLHVHDQVMLPEALKVSTSRWTPSLLEVEHSWRLVGEPE